MHVDFSDYHDHMPTGKFFILLPTKSGIFLPEQQLMELLMTGQYIGVYSVRGFFTTKSVSVTFNAEGILCT